jgi:hypothetical protein
MNPLAFPVELKTEAFRPDALNGGKQLHRVLQAFPYVSKRFGCTIEAPAGFVTDFASVPRAVKWLIDDNDRHMLYPAIPHDVLYECRGALPNGPTLTRYQADLVLKDAMNDIGAPGWKRALVFSAVRVGGWLPWKKD